MANFANYISTFVSNMVAWGSNLITNFATGIINAASTVLIAAINYVSSILAYWFAPGSPPQVAPMMDIWGTMTMEEYLHGFEEADFSILDAIQGSLKTALDALVISGDIGKEAGAQIYLDMTQGLIEAISTGILSQALLDEIAAAGGEYGDELVELIQQQFALAQAMDAMKIAQEAYDAAKEAGAAMVQAADEKAKQARADYDATVLSGQKAIEEAEKRREAAGKAVNQGLMEYNQMLRGGASKAALAAKLAEINANKKKQSQAEQDIVTTEEANAIAEEAAQAKIDAAEAEAEAARDASDALIAAAQIELDLAKQNIEALQTQIDYLEDLIAAMAELDKLKNEPEPTVPPTTPVIPPGGGGGGGGIPIPEIPIPEPLVPFDPSALLTPFRDAVNAAMEEIKTIIWVKLMWLKREAITAWVAISTALKTSGLAEQWEKIKEAAGTAWAYIQAEAKDVIARIGEWWTTYGGDVTTIWNEIMIVVGNVVGWILKSVGTLIAPIGKIFQGIWLFVKYYFGMIGLFIGTALKLVAAVITGNFGKIPEIIGGYFTKMQEIVKGILLGVVTFIWGIWDAISAIAVSIGEVFNLQGVVDAIIAWGTQIWDYLFGGLLFPDMLTAITTFITNFIASIVTWMTGIWTSITTIATTISTAWTTFWDGVSLKATEIWTAIVTWVTTKITEIQAVIGTIVAAIQLVWGTFWDAVSLKATEIWTAIVTWVTTKITEAQTAIGTVTAAITEAWTIFWDAVSLKATDIWNTISSTVTTMITTVQTTIQTIIDAISTAWTTFWDTVSTKASEILTTISTTVTTQVTAIQTTFTTITTAISTAWATFWTGAGTTLSTAFTTMVTNVGTNLGTIKTYFATMASDALTALSGFGTNLYTAAVNAINSFRNGITNTIGNVLGAIQGAIDRARKLVQELLGIHSPSTVFANIGKQTMLGMAQGITANISLPEKAMTTAAGRAASAAVPITTGATSYYQPNINMNTTINSGMQATQLEAFIIRTVKKGLTK